MQSLRTSNSAACKFENGFTPLKYVLGQGSHHPPVGIIPGKSRSKRRVSACETLRFVPSVKYILHT